MLRWVLGLVTGLLVLLVLLLLELPGAGMLLRPPPPLKPARGVGAVAADLHLGKG